MYIDPYSRGYTVDLGNGEVQVERVALQPALLSNYKAIHTVLDGETIQSIAYQYFKDSGRWMDICDVNGIYNPLTELTPGMQLYIPY